MAFIESVKKQSGGSGGHTILDNEGTSLTQRDDLQFKGAYSEDDSTDEKTVVNVVREMTKAEFDQLTEEEKTGFINITDITGGGDDRFQPVIYSEDEREIGVWIDGKPLYQKTVYIATITSPSTTVAHGISNLDWIVDYSLIGLYAGETKEIAPSSGSSASIGVVIGSWDSTNISFNMGNLSYGFSDCYLTIRYTKSSDTAGSGQWTPQGVPAHHYSEDEQVVGTWIDGSTLYEKTIKFNNKNVTNSESTSELVHGVSNIDTAFVHSAYIDFNGTEKWATAMNVIVVGSSSYRFEWTIGSSAIYLEADNLSFSASTDRTYLFVIRYTKSST